MKKLEKSRKSLEINKTKKKIEPNKSLLAERLIE